MREVGFEELEPEHFEEGEEATEEHFGSGEILGERESGKKEGKE